MINKYYFLMCLYMTGIDNIEWSQIFLKLIASINSTGKYESPLVDPVFDTIKAIDKMGIRIQVTEMKDNGKTHAYYPTAALDGFTDFREIYKKIIG